MKITFEDGSVMEFSGSAEGGELTEKEQELAKKVLDDRHQERMKAFEENRIVQVEMSKNQAEISKNQAEMSKHQAEMSMISSNTYGKFWDSIRATAEAVVSNNQRSMIEDTFEHSTDQLDLSPNIISKDEKPFDPDKRIKKSVK